jgi:DNA-binding PucR family transcriptional regulator
MGEIAAWVQDAAPHLVELMLERMRVEVPAYFASQDPGFMDMARESIVANLQAVADGLTSGRDQPGQLPPGAVEEALMAAEQRMPWTLIDRTYRIGHAVLWEQLLGEVETWHLSSSERVDLLRVSSHFLFQYVDHVTGGLAEVHQAERDRQIRGRERRRIAWVREVLADVGGAASGGDYDLDRQHLAAIAWGAVPDRAIIDLGQRLAAAALVVPGQSGSTWGWLGSRSIASSWASLSRRLSLPADTFLAIGAPGRGAEGFRLSHRQALEAARVLRLTGARLGAYDDLALDALVLRDERAARDFMRRELGPLLDDGKRTQILLETLRSYADSNWNAASTGARLGVHERTVGYRLATIEQRLGHPLAARREEIGVALRLQAALAPTSAFPKSPNGERTPAPSAERAASRRDDDRPHGARTDQ